VKTIECKKITVFDILKWHDDIGSIESKFWSRWPCLINSNQYKQIKYLIINDKTQNWWLCVSGIKELWKKKIKQNVSINTIRHSLYSIRLKNCIIWHKPHRQIK